MKFSTDEYLGATGGLIIALAFPLGRGLYDLIKHRKFKFIALLGLISILLTGGLACWLWTLNGWRLRKPLCPA